MIAPPIGKTAKFEISVNPFKMILAGIIISVVTIIPIAPEKKPIEIDSAVNTRLISRFDAPIARNIPISFIRSNTDI